MAGVVAYDVRDSLYEARKELAQASTDRNNKVSQVNAAIKLIMIQDSRNVDENLSNFISRHYPLTNETIDALPDINMEVHKEDAVVYYKLLSLAKKGGDEYETALAKAVEYGKAINMYQAIEDWSRIKRYDDIGVSYEDLDKDKDIPPLSPSADDTKYETIKAKFDLLASRVASAIKYTEDQAKVIKCKEDQAKALLLVYNQSGPIGKSGECTAVLECSDYSRKEATKAKEAEIIRYFDSSGNLTFSYETICPVNGAEAKQILKVVIPSEYSFTEERYLDDTNYQSRLVVSDRDPNITSDLLQDKIQKGINVVAELQPLIKEDLKQTAPTPCDKAEIVLMSKPPLFFSYQYYAAKKTLGRELTRVEKFVDTILTMVGRAPVVAAPTAQDSVIDHHGETWPQEPVGELSKERLDELRKAAAVRDGEFVAPDATSGAKGNEKQNPLSR